jgi:hypothetical protein
MTFLYGGDKVANLPNSWPLGSSPAGFSMQASGVPGVEQIDLRDTRCCICSRQLLTLFGTRDQS